MSVNRAAETLEPRTRTRQARVGIVGAAVLLATVVVLEFAVGEPPSDGDALLDWMDTNRLGLILLDEALVFAGLALTAATALARRAAPPALRDRLSPIVALAMLTTVIMFVTALAGGRFVYPVHDIAVEDSESAGLVAGLFYGGMHMLWLALGVLAAAVTAAMRASCGRRLTIVGVVATLAAIIASYPEVLGPELTLVVRLVFVAAMLILAAAVPAEQLPGDPGPRASTADELTGATS